MKRSAVSSTAKARLPRAFTLLELLVVIGLMAVLSLFLFGGLRGGGKTAALQSGQATVVNLLTVARTKAMATGQSARLLVHVDANSTEQPSRFLRCVVVQIQNPVGWQTVTAAYLPEGVYVVPGNFSSIPAGLFATGTAGPWTKSDASALRSTALRANAVTTDTINGADAAQWAAITISANAGTAQSGDLILASGRPRAPGAYQLGESPVELDNPEAVRGLTLSAYGVPALINGRSSF